MASELGVGGSRYALQGMGRDVDHALFRESDFLYMIPEELGNSVKVQ